MNILFVHSNYPAQFKHLTERIRKEGIHNIKFLAQNREWNSERTTEGELISYQVNRVDSGQLCHPHLKRFEKAILVAQASLRAGMKLNEQVFKPDLIIGHSGFGATMYLKELWPKARFIGYFEWFYRSTGSDVGFGSNDQTSPDKACKVHTYNAPILLDMALCDKGITPTKWQAKQFPNNFRKTLEIVFDGINIEKARPLIEENEKKGLDINGISIEPEIPLVTYTTRGFEEYRGWPQVAKGISLLMQRNPQVQVLLVGSDEVAYGRKRSDGKSWRQWACETYDYDPRRIHFLPPLQYEEYIQVLQYSWVHIYWTVPFVLSWGLMEAMSCGCSIVASNTEPVKEMIRPGQEGVLVDFFDTDGMAARIDELLKDKDHRRHLGSTGRKKIIKGGYSIDECVKQQLKIINEVMG